MIRTFVSKSSKLRRVLTTKDYYRGLRHGVAAATEHEKIVFGREYQTIIDVGANRGQFALFARHRFPEARMVCFEPLSQARDTLHQLFRQDRNVRIESCALGSTTETTELVVTRSDDSSSLLRPTTLQTDLFPNSNAIDSIPITVKRLDDLIAIQDLDTPFLLKIDVQGFELEVLHGAPNLLQADGDVLVESSFAELYTHQALADEVICLLFENQYRLKGIYSITYGANGAPLQGDLFFTRIP